MCYFTILRADLHPAPKVLIAQLCLISVLSHSFSGLHSSPTAKPLHMPFVLLGGMGSSSFLSFG